MISLVCMKSHGKLQQNPGQKFAEMSVCGMSNFCDSLDLGCFEWRKETFSNHSSLFLIKGEIVCL